jgi:hypothetical protein
LPRGEIMWHCPKCKREFKKNNQSHSCAVFPLEKHFIGKDYAKELFDYYIVEVRKKIKPLKIESLPCCIHLVTDFTFGAVWAMKDKIRIDFRLDKKVEIKSEAKITQISPNRFMYYLDIKDKKEITPELINLIEESTKLNS